MPLPAAQQSQQIMLDQINQTKSNVFHGPFGIVNWLEEACHLALDVITPARE
jgi:hypothetical protein